ncbi:hypothetical protein DYB26_006489 [Aphanomyces astaci]|uniref:Uncharacterized protein n=1 Tax=Aphanomyces astaci TaxID=112090 RepID=A0A397BDR1_APHAT|nr:hypothetical protein DYB36_007172 [Aphanomyces astaci]RHY73549.1 hypothetical protein DYB38_006610 [Aphanomyces astaci]RHZ24071.1 hypothetical protein DYB26_006489 [Aphanomyces astaci]
MALALSDAVVQSYGIARVFPGEEDVLTTSVDFHRTGGYCATARRGVVSHINCTTGMLNKNIHTKQYGAEIVRFTHHPDCMIWSSQNDFDDHAIRYHSVYDNKFLRYFSGHTKKVTSLMMHPTADEFLTASMDSTFRMWDIRVKTATGLLNCGENNTAISAAYDSDGLVFGVYTGDSLVRMYDARNYNDGRFLSFVDTIIDVVLFLHHPDQQHILLNTNAGLLVQLDAFEGKLVRSIVRADDGSMTIYNANTGAVTAAAKPGHIGPVMDVQWNPQRHLIASVHANTIFWMPPATPAA